MLHIIAEHHQDRRLPSVIAPLRCARGKLTGTDIGVVPADQHLRPDAETAPGLDDVECRVGNRTDATLKHGKHSVGAAFGQEAGGVARPDGPAGPDARRE